MTKWSDSSCSSGKCFDARQEEQNGKNAILAGVTDLLAGTAVAADYKVAVVDIDRIMRESVCFLRATKKLEKELKIGALKCNA